MPNLGEMRCLRILDARIINDLATQVCKCLRRTYSWSRRPVRHDYGGAFETMWTKSPVILLVTLVAAHQATAQQPQQDVQTLAHAYDRCMATQAVRLTRTDATDADIFRQATQACLSLQGLLRAAISAQLPPAQAAEILGPMDAQAEPNFMAMLARIRSDRARRANP